MSMRPQSFGPVPEDTARIAKRAFRKGNIYLTIGDQIGLVFSDADFSHLYAADGAPAVSPVILALVVIFQFIEDLSDEAAADSVRARIDWKYALHLPLGYPGFDASLLSDFRARLVQHAAGQQMFEQVLLRLKTLGLVRKGGKQRTDSTYVLAAVRTLNRLELVAETMRLALEALAEDYPDWLRSIAQPHWYERYNRVLSTFRLPKAQEKREALALEIGGDGFYLLEALKRSDCPHSAVHLPEVETLRKVWEQQLEPFDGQQVRWRARDKIPPGAELMNSPHDVEVRHTVRRDKEWTGHRVHWTESCDQGEPHLITHVETTAAPVPDVNVVKDIHAALASLDLLPAKHLLDEGYVAGHLLVESRDKYGIDIIGRVGKDTSWQARMPDGITLGKFQIDWEAQRAICPQGEMSVRWSPSTDQYGHPMVHVQFPKAACAGCPSRPRCTKARRGGRASKISMAHEAIQAARERQKTQAFRDAYKRRAGIEGTVSETVNVHGARRSRYIGHDKTHLQTLLTATGVNLKRAAWWLMGKRQRTTRPAGLSCLAPLQLPA